MKDFNGKLAVITGGASGVGFAIGEALAKEGAKVILTDVEEESLQKSSKFFEDLKINNLNIYFDTQVTLAKKFGLRGIPTTILFDKNGLEFARIIGSIDFKDEKFIKWLSKFN